MNNAIAKAWVGGGVLMAVLTVMKGLPFSYARDLQEDKEPLFDTLQTIEECLLVMQGVIKEIVFNTDRMEMVFDEAVFATDIADYLTNKGMPFRKAHEVAGKLVKWSQENSILLSDIPSEIFKKYSGLFEKDVRDIFDLRSSADRRSLQGGTGENALRKQIKRALEILKKEDTI